LDRCLAYPRHDHYNRGEFIFSTSLLRLRRVVRCQSCRKYKLSGLGERRCRVKYCTLQLLALFALVIIGVDAWAQGRPDKDKIRIGYAARAVAHSVPFVAKEAGFFAEEGIDAEIIRTAGSIAPMALVANEVDLAIMSAYLMIPVAERNKDVVMLGGFSRYASMVFVSRPDVKGALDLKGKIVGIQRPGDAYEKSARFALKHLGLDADKDVKMLALGTNDVMWSALQTGKVSATILSPPGTLFARKAGMNFMVDLNDLKLEYQGSTIATRRSFVQKNPGLATRSLRAIIRGVHLFKTRKEDTMRILAKFLGTKDREALEESWDYAAKMPAKPYAVESAVQAVLDHLAEGQAKFSQHRPSEFIDARLLLEIDKSGYIDRLYGDSKAR
jgi:ABC-type nitrate/sulfonate/bicarbonate transport system substrate-binding protein